MKSKLANIQAQALASMIFSSFQQNETCLQKTSQNLQDLFKQQNWSELAQIPPQRKAAQQQILEQTAAQLRDEIGANALSDAIWLQARTAYQNLLVDHNQTEWALIFFHSVTQHIFQKPHEHTPLLTQTNNALVSQDDINAMFYRSSKPSHDLMSVWSDVLKYFHLTQSLGHHTPTLEALKTQTLCHLKSHQQPVWDIQILSQVFYRHQCAHLLGHVIENNQCHPFVLTLSHDEDQKIKISQLLFDMATMTSLFQIGQDAFIVETTPTDTLTQALHFWLPTLNAIDCHVVLGQTQHAEQLFYQALCRQLKENDAIFQMAAPASDQELILGLSPWPYVVKISAQPQNHHQSLLTYPNLNLPLKHIDAETMDILYQHFPDVLSIQNDTITFDCVTIEHVSDS